MRGRPSYREIWTRGKRCVGGIQVKVTEREGGGIKGAIGR